MKCWMIKSPSQVNVLGNGELNNEQKKYQRAQLRLPSLTFEQIHLLSMVAVKEAINPSHHSIHHTL